MRCIVLTALLLLTLSRTVAAEVTLAWDPSPDANVVRYYVYYGAGSADYTNRVNAGNATSVTISNLLVAGGYYFAATAVDDSGLESDFSNEISYTVPVPQQMAVIELAGLEHFYDGTPKAATVTVTPANLDYTVTYDGALTLPVSPGTYTVVAAVTSTGYTGSASNTMVVGKASACVMLANLAQDYTGSACAATVTTIPADLPVSVTYNGSTAVPTELGAYTVVATVNSNNFSGGAAGTLTIKQACTGIVKSVEISWAFDLAMTATDVTVLQSTNLVSWEPALIDQMGPNSVTVSTDAERVFFRADAKGQPLPVKMQVMD